MTTYRGPHVVLRRAWWGLVAIAVVIVVFGIGDALSGISADSAIATSVTGRTVDQIRAEAPDVAALADVGVRIGGVTMVVLGVGWILVLVGGVRRGARWAWRAMWTMPAWTFLVSAVWVTVDRAPGTPLPPPMVSGPVLLVASVLLVLASRPRAADAGLPAQASEIDRATFAASR